MSIHVFTKGVEWEWTTAALHIVDAFHTHNTELKKPDKNSAWSLLVYWTDPTSPSAWRLHGHVAYVKSTDMCIEYVYFTYVMPQQKNKKVQAH